MPILYLQSSSFPRLKTWMTKKTDKYTSPVIQNECLKTMALCIIWQITNKIGKSLCYSIIADDCTDIASKEQLQFVLGGLTVIFKIIKILLVYISGTDCLVFHIKDALLWMNINLSKCRGQCYDACVVILSWQTKMNINHNSSTYIATLQQ